MWRRSEACAVQTVKERRAFDEFGIVEIACAGVRAIERGDLEHLLVGETEVEDIEVFLHALLAYRLRNGMQPR